MCTAEALQLALERISSLLVSLSQAGKSLQPSELQLLSQLVEALRNNHPEAHDLIR